MNSGSLSESGGIGRHARFRFWCLGVGVRIPPLVPILGFEMHKRLLKLSRDEIRSKFPEATHQHYKGGLYQLIGEGIHTETNEELVFYRHVYPYEEAYYARPSKMFHGLNEGGDKRFVSL